MLIYTFNLATKFYSILITVVIKAKYRFIDFILKYIMYVYFLTILGSKAIVSLYLCSSSNVF